PNLDPALAENGDTMRSVGIHASAVARRVNRRKPRSGATRGSQRTSSRVYVAVPEYGESSSRPLRPISTTKRVPIHVYCSGCCRIPAEGASALHSSPPQFTSKLVGCQDSFDAGGDFLDRQRVDQDARLPDNLGERGCPASDNRSTAGKSLQRRNPEPLIERRVDEH